MKQHDDYSWQRWSRQALPIGRLSESPLVHHVFSGALRLGLLLP